MTVSLHIFCGQVKIKLSKNRPHRIAYKPRYRTQAYKGIAKSNIGAQKGYKSLWPFFR